ncbi:MAG TPA: molybdenum cofactor guanylyltransferase [Crenotrichaceae bacterium]|nr:molybdenum cofactor guanylyltransferase [Crenotrichaceae bacterium]
MVLAGGLARRFNSEDKGLISLLDKPLVSYALDVLVEVADPVVINANRNQSRYEALGFSVIADLDQSYSGPLAGLLSVMRSADTDLVLSVPCDCPLITTEILSRMIETLETTQADCCIPDDGERVHPVFLLVKTALQYDLAAYLQSGERKIDSWLKQHHLVIADCSDQPDCFINVNTPEQLSELQAILV